MGAVKIVLICLGCALGLYAVLTLLGAVILGTLMDRRQRAGHGKEEV